MNPQDTIGVKEFIKALDLHLQFGYQNVTVEGEVSGLRATPATFQFSLKEEEAVLRSVIFKNRMNQPLEDGMKIRATGTPGLHPQYGFSFKVETIELAGEGELKRAFELLKAKLEGEGLFDPARKRELPQFPKRIGLVTSKEGAVLHDFLRVVNSRWGGLEIILAPVMVQGIGSVEQIVGALRYLNQLPDPVDVLVLIRGGGSLEDLQSFNSEPVAREVAGSRTPIIVGVGHEPDISLADLVADVRAATPTHAAQIVVPSREEIGRRLNQEFINIGRCMSQLVTENGRRLQALPGSLEAVLRRPLEQVRMAEMRLRQFLTRFGGEVARYQQNLQGLSRLLAASNPTGILSRGYSITYSGGVIVKDKAQVKPGDKLVIKLHASELKAKADE